jgi:hypothetical protein
MDRTALTTIMKTLLKAAVDEEGEYNEIEIVDGSPLVGGEAVLSSVGLVSYALDVEAAVAESFDAQITLVTEQALSRRHSPFRTVGTLADYVVELVTGEVPAEAADESELAAG